MSPWGFGRGLGPNLSWNCRWFPWLPRWWWAYPPEVMAQMTGQPFPQQPPTAQPVGSQPGQALGPTSTQFGPFAPPPAMGTMTKEQEKQMLEQQAEFLRQQLEQLQKRLNELTKEE